MTKLLIRHAESVDHQSIIRVVDDWWGGRRMASMLPRLFFIHFRNTSFVAEQDGSIVGFVVGFVSQTFPEQAYIHFVGVDPRVRMRGIAQSLYETFFSTVRKLGCRTAHCVTSPTNMDSIAFHRRMGFSIEDTGTVINGVSVSEHYDGLDGARVLFSKTLTNVGEDCVLRVGHVTNSSSK